VSTRSSRGSAPDLSRPEELGDPDAEKSQRVVQAMLKMKKIEIDALEPAAAQR